MQGIIENGMVHWMELDLISANRYVVFEWIKKQESSNLSPVGKLHK